MPKKLSKSRVILARRKSGKTAFVQRLFNQLWHENGPVIPFYFNVSENKIWLTHFVIEYYRTFASHYISFLERDERLVRHLLTLEEIQDYGRTHGIELLVHDTTQLLEYEVVGRGRDLMWCLASSAPHRFASIYDQRILVIIDEFQYLTRYIYPDQDFQASPIETMPGSFHSHAESKVAPMLVTGSYVSWLMEISLKYLEAGRLSKRRMSPYLTPEGRRTTGSLQICRTLSASDHQRDCHLAEPTLFSGPLLYRLRGAK